MKPRRPRGSGSTAAYVGTTTLDFVAAPSRRRIRGLSKPRLYIGGVAASLVGDRLDASLDRFTRAEDAAKTELVLVTPDEIEELIEDALATAAYDRTRGQESVSSEIVGRILAGENRIRVWRQHRGLTLDQLAAKTGIGKGYLSQIERGQRSGTLDVYKRLAAALALDIDELAG